VAVRDGVITAVGATREIQALAGPRTETLDLAGRLAIPGFIESHGHLLSLGRSLAILGLGDAPDWREIAGRVRQAARGAAPGAWIEGRGWHQEKWRAKPEPDVEGYPVHAAISQAAPDNPVILTHSSGHFIMANAAAMAVAGVTRESADPPGGKILRDAAGEPTGIFMETAIDLVRRLLEEERARRSQAEIEFDARQAIQRATAHCLAQGVTSFQDAGSTFEDIDRLKALAQAHSLGMRLWAMIWDSNARMRECLRDYRFANLGDHRLTVRALKRLSDGALGARSAWLFEPYDDLPATRGFATLCLQYDDLPAGAADDPDAPLSYIAETARLALEHGFQLCTHAIGDRAVHEVLNVYERAWQRHPRSRDLRWRIEHASVITEPDLQRFGQLGVIASMQACSLPSDGLWMLKRLGEARSRKRAFAFQDLKRGGAIIANGTDAPVDDINPLIGFHALATCQLADGVVFWPEQRLSREDALRAYTLDGAYAAFEEDLKGSISPGKLADIVVLTHDIMTVPEDEILQAKVAHTIVGGQVVHSL
jgi:predicted amidohydrolase YtcJ